MTVDPSYLTRCRLWAALSELVPEAHREEANRYATDLNAEYWALIQNNADIAQDAKRELAAEREELETLTTLAAAPSVQMH